MVAALMTRMDERPDDLLTAMSMKERRVVEWVGRRMEMHGGS